MTSDRSDESFDRGMQLVDQILVLVNGEEYATAATAVALAHVCLTCASPKVETICDAQEALRGFPKAAEGMVRAMFARIKEGTRCVLVEANNAEEAREKARAMRRN